MVEKISAPPNLELQLSPAAILTVRDWDESDKAKSLHHLRDGTVKLTLYYIIDDESLPSHLKGKRLVATPTGLIGQGHLKKDEEENVQKG